MAAIKTGTARSGSTTWAYDSGEIGGSRREGKARVAKPRRWRSLNRRNPKAKLTLTIQFKGGAECWYLIEARGSSGIVSGAIALHDVMREITGAYDI